MLQLGRSAKRTEVELRAALDSPRRFPPSRIEDLPPYGAQHRQDALWKGGNEALPPLWHQFTIMDGKMGYQDDTLGMTAWTQPLPGVRLDEPGNLVPGCEWHISPLGRSYFVHHNTRSTSWRMQTPERPAGSLAPECVIEGHSRCIWNLASFGIGCNIISASGDGSIRQWRRDGEPVGDPWCCDGGWVSPLAVSADETMVVSGSEDGKIRLWDVKKGSMVGDPWEGHKAPVRCLEWSPNAREIASGSEDGTIRRWDPDTGRQIAPPIRTSHFWVFAVSYSPQGDKFVSSGAEKIIRMWSKEGELLKEIKGHDNRVMSLCWSKDGAYIFSASEDRTIRKWQSITGEELVVLRGHISSVRSLYLSPDGRHLVSASVDCSIRIWDLKTNQQVGDPLLHDDALWAITMSPDGNYIVSAGLNAKIYVWSLEAALKPQRGGEVGSVQNGNAEADAMLKERIALSRHVKNRGLATHGSAFWGNDTSRTPGRLAPLTNSSSPSRRKFLDFFRSRTTAITTAQPILPPPRYKNTRAIPVSKPRHLDDVAPCRIDERHGIVPPTEAEVAAAMQYANASGGMADSLTPQGQRVATAQGLHTQFSEEQNVAVGTGESSYEIGCCGLRIYSVRPRTASH